MGDYAALWLVALGGKTPRLTQVAARLCEAHGYAGLLFERDGKPDEARAAFEAAVEVEFLSFVFVEYRYARSRLAQSAALEHNRRTKGPEDTHLTDDGVHAPD
ncbi:MAG: hypothetical protein ACYS22_22130 [Planctomycetota bacterium]|jgi:lipoprotein NlpI